MRGVVASASSMSASTRRGSVVKRSARVRRITRNALQPLITRIIALWFLPQGIFGKEALMLSRKNAPAGRRCSVRLRCCGPCRRGRAQGNQPHESDESADCRALEKPVVKKQLELLRLRRNCPVFAQGAKVQIESCGPELTIEWSGSGHVARLQANLQKLTYRVEIE